MWKKTILSSMILLLFGGGSLWAYYQFLRPFRIATIGFSDSDWANWEDALTATPYTLHRYGDEGLEEAPLGNYNLVFIRGQGLNLTPQQLSKIGRAKSRGTHFYIRTATNALSAQQTTVPEVHREEIANYIQHGGKENLIAMAHYTAHHLGGREVAIPPLIEKPQSGFFHLDNQLFESLADYEHFLASREIEDATDRPRVALIGSFMDPQDEMNRKPVDTIIRALEKGGAKVYPIFGRDELFSLLSEIHPDVIFTFPHGRFSYDTRGEQLLRQLDCPIVSALPLLNSREQWLEDERGMEGGFLGQSITAPELDGIIEPIAVSSMEPNDRNYNVRTPLEDQIAARVNLTLNWARLRKKANAEKKIAIVYYKSPGNASLAAGGLEVAPALWNTLKRLQSEGYDLGENVPESPDALFDLIQSKGKTIGQWALGAMEQFLNDSEPELIPAERYADWFQKTLSVKRQKETLDRWGDIPGTKMVTMVNDRPHLVISRIQLGNVVIMPQPTVGGGDENEDEISSIHGTDQAVPHFYLGAYLWARYGFKADAIMHFGTHGSLEFTYGKSNCLSRDCWPQILIGDIPHIYPYIINNVGEALVAKRRSNAVIVSHLTPPFMEAGLYGELSLLHGKIHDWEQAEDPLLREETKRSITTLVSQMNLAEDLSIDGASLEERLLSDEELDKVHNYIHQLKDQSVTDGLHVIGRPYSDEQVERTATAMLGEQGVDQLLASLENHPNPDSMEYRQEVAGQFVRQVLQAKLTPNDLFSSEKREAIRVALEKLKASRQTGQDSARPDGYSGATQRHSASPQESSVKSSEAEHPKAPHTMGSNPEDSVHPGNAPKSESTADEKSSQDFTDQSSSSPETAVSLQTGYFHPQMTLVAFQDRTAVNDDSIEENSALDEASIEPTAVIRDQAWKSIDELKSWIADDPEKQQWLLDAIDSIQENAANLRQSPQSELDEIVASLNAEYIAPSSGGDPLGNPAAVPTGRNLYSINAEQTPSPEAWRVGMKLTDQLLDSHKAQHGGDYPRQIAISLWGGEFIRGKGTAIAQILYLMGMRPLWNSRGVVYDVEVIPSSELGRPRIDVLVQTSGQFRDAAASRIALMDRAVQIANGLADEPFPNYVREGTESTEQEIKAQGVSARDARDFATARIFGSASNSSYGTQIMGMVEKGDTWEEAGEVAQRYIKNMSGVYRDGDRWGTVVPGLLEAQMQGVDAVVHPRSSNTWGPLSLDHVYEFMGGITLAVRETTGKDPDGYFSDLRQPGRAKVTTAVGAIREEARTTLWNPKFITGMQREGASAAASLTETVRNMYGWNVMQPSVISQDMWDETYRVYIEDRHELQMREYFEAKNPFAYQDLTAVMLETARKGYWTPDANQLQELAKLHTELVAEYGAACSYETCGNQSLHAFIGQQLDAVGETPTQPSIAAYQQALASVLEPTSQTPEVSGIEMNEVFEEELVPSKPAHEKSSNWAIFASLMLLCGGLIAGSLKTY